MGKKITILGAGKVGATIAYTLVVDGTAAEIVLIDVNMDKAKGEAMDIIQGTPYCEPVDIYAGDFSCAKGSDIVILTVGLPRQPGQSRIDLAKNNIEITKEVMAKTVKYAPDAIYVIVSNPVDILTYVAAKGFGLEERQVIGSGTQLDTSRLRQALAKHCNLAPINIHAYVWGEHGDTAMIPWSLTSIGGMSMQTHCDYICPRRFDCATHEAFKDIENDVKTSGAQVIGLKGSTFFAVSLSARRICRSLFNSQNNILTVSGMLHGEYGLDEVCISLPFIVNGTGIVQSMTPPLLDEELRLLQHSGQAMKDMIAQFNL